MVTLEEYLNRPNPDIDNSNTSPGPNTVHAGYSHISGFEDWGEFNYKTLRSLYGDVLDQVLPTVPHDQNPIGLETQIWDEKQLEFVVSQYILYPVRFALRQAYRFCEQSWNHNTPHEFTIPIDPGAGGRAKRPTDTDDPRFRPDWSAVKENHMTSSTPRSYFNFCPGDTKLARKWKFEWCFTDLDSWVEPLKQTQTYSGDHWNVRFGWIITEEGVTSCLITREVIDPGLASAKEPRLSVSTTPGHARVASGDTDISSLIAPLSITTQSYREDHPSVDYKHIKVKFTSWQEARKGHLNVKTALFFLFMLAGAPGGPKLVQTDYPPLDSWWHEGEYFRHNSTGRMKRRLQSNEVLCQASGQSTDTAVPTNTSSQADTATHAVFEEGRGTEVASAQEDEGKQGKRRKIERKGR
jgi:hypothetical protein